MGEEGTQERDTEQHPAKEERLQIGLAMGRYRYNSVKRGARTPKRSMVEQQRGGGAS